MSHDEYFGCGNDHSPKCITPDQVIKNQKDFLHQLHHRHYLPATRFALTHSREPDFLSTALAPVFIRNASDEMAMVKEAGAFRQKLGAWICFPWTAASRCAATATRNIRTAHSMHISARLCPRVRVSPVCLANPPMLDLSSMALTEVGEQIAAAHCGHDHHHE